MITANNITSHELIGLHAQVIESTNPQVIGLCGIIINETKSMLSIDTVKGVRSLPKNTNVWEFLTGKDRITVLGSKITKRPFDRIGGKV